VQPIVPSIFRTGNPDIDRNLDQIYQAIRRLALVQLVTPVVVSDHRFLTHKNDRVAGVGQHSDDTVDMADAATMVRNLLGLTTVRQAMAVLDALDVRTPSASVMPVHANDQARWLMDEARTLTFECANTGHTAGNISFSGGTAYQGVPGLRDANCVRMMTDARLLTAVQLFEYQVFSLHYWLRLNNVPNASGANPCVGVLKMSNPGAFTTPYYSAGLVASSTTISCRVLKTVSPREYVELSITPASIINQFPLYQWMHLAMTWNGTHLIMYVNGREFARSAAQTGITVRYDNRGEWCVGHPFGITSTSDCLIQDIRINDTALPESYFAELWHRGNIGNSALLYAY
jgi:hypothetical protein